VGFNTNSVPIQDFILETIASLRKKDPTRIFSPLYSQFVQPPFALRKTTEQSLDISMHRIGGDLLP
jgi:hypothetical protein